MSDVKLLKISTEEYRGLKMPSYSSLKKLDEVGPRNFDKLFTVEGDAIDFGSYVDCIMFTPENEEKDFYFKSIKKPTGQVLELADYILNNLFGSFDNYYENVELTEALSRELELFGSTKVYEKRVANFDTDVFWNYLYEMREANGKAILSIDIKTEASQAIELIKNHSKTIELFYPDENIEGINQMQLIGSIKGVLTKGMLDRVLIDHKNKIIRGYDLKCTEMRQINFPYMFVKMKYYLQASLYNTLLTMYAAEYYPDYTVDQFRFIVYSRSDKYPFIWRVSDAFLENGLIGYTDAKGMYHKGVMQLLTEYKYYNDNNSFVIEMEFIENNELELL